jgi:hypothetical protein
MKQAALGALAAVLALLSGALLAASPMQPGKWDSTISVARAGRVPLVSSESDCITQGEIDSGTKSLPKPGDDCQLSNVVTAGARSTYDFVCKDGDAVLRGRAEFQIEATRYDGRLDMTARKGDAPEIATTMTWTARRVGECK